ncbi:MAG: DUF3971 domain-containing protein [Gammaproteobacteria bacterium]|nr:DUF3971 domain-containing protein [Gammaproteobacteria bacterium]
MTWLEKLRLYLIYIIAIFLIVMAVAFSVLRAVLPHATGYVKEVEQALSEQTGLSVSITSMDADMYWLMPRLKLVDVVIYDSDRQHELLHLDEAFFALAFVDSLLQWSPTVGDVSLVGANLYIERYANNRWRIQGVEFGGSTVASGGDDAKEVIEAIRNTDFSLLNINIHWRDYQLSTGQLDFIGSNLYIEEFLDQHSLEIDLNLPAVYGKKFRLIAKADGDIAKLSEADLAIYLQGESIDIAQCLSVINIEGIPSVKGVFSGELWLDRIAGIFSQVVVDASVKQLEVKRQSYGSFHLNNITGKVGWKKNSTGWQFSSRDIHLARDVLAWPELSSVVAEQNEQGLKISASYVRLHDLIYLATPFLDAEQLKFVKDSQLGDVSGDLYNTSVLWPGSGKDGLQLSTVFENLFFHLPDTDISLQGLDGALQYQGGDGRVELLSESVKMNFGSLFRQPMDIDLINGVVSIWRDNNNWVIASDDLYLLNSDAELFARLNLSVKEDATIFADIQTDFRNVIGASIHKYYPVSIMSKDLVAWLDMAITDGFVDSGSFILHGDIGRFPYAANDGVMEIVFDTSYLKLKFLEGWPAVNDFSSHVRFYNDSMFIDNVTGQVYRGRLSKAVISIPELASPRLFIDGHVKAPAEDFQQYVWNSGLDKVMGKALKQFQANGNTDLDLHLEVPLGDSSDAVLVKGGLQFNGNEMYLPIMDYTLNNVSGRLSFEGDQISAENIKADFEKAPVSIDVVSVAIEVEDKIEKSFTGAPDGINGNKPVSETVAYINGKLPADGLLRKFSWIPEGWIDGASDWAVALHFPKMLDEYLVQVTMNSSLEGTEISFSDSMTKSSKDLLPVDIDLKVRIDSLQLEVKSTDNFTLSAVRNNEDMWDFVVDSSLIRGSGIFAEDLNRDSTATLELEYIDLLTLFKSSKKGGDSVALKPTFFPSLNFKTKVLLWDDWTFNDVNLNTSWQPQGMLVNSVNLQGPALKIHGQGSWFTTWQNRQESRFKFFVDSSDLGHTLSVMNLTQNMKGSVQSAVVNWQWYAEPYRFSWQTVQGNSHFTMKDGAVKALDPGAGGRIVGLFNVFKLFDRLTLDFKDVSGEGFAFDSIEGDFEFGNGLASSKNIEITASAADMRMQGSIGMVARDYDLIMQVRPHSSEAFFTGGALVGGPVLGAGLVLINKLFGLEKSAYDEYQITGSWDDPQIKQTGKRSNEENSDSGGEGK